MVFETPGPRTFGVLGCVKTLAESKIWAREGKKSEILGGPGEGWSGRGVAGRTPKTTRNTRFFWVGRKS